MQKPWAMCYWGGRPPEDWMFSQVYAEGANWNDTYWSHETFNKLLVEARAELNPKKRRALYVEMQQIVRDEGGVVIPMFASAVAGASDKIRRREAVAGNWELDGNKATERWWFA